MLILNYPTAAVSTSHGRNMLFDRYIESLIED